MDASTPTGSPHVGRERPCPRARGTSSPRVPSVCGGQQRAASSQVRSAEVGVRAAATGVQLLTEPLFPSVLNLNLVFIAGCVLAALAMISAVVVYKTKMSGLGYQPLPTQECDTAQ